MSKYVYCLRLVAIKVNYHQMLSVLLLLTASGVYLQTLIGQLVSLCLVIYYRLCDYPQRLHLTNVFRKLLRNSFAFASSGCYDRVSSAFYNLANSTMVSVKGQALVMS